MQTETNHEQKQAILDMINQEVKNNIKTTATHADNSEQLNSNNDALLYIRF